MTSVLSFRNLCASIQQECMASPFRTYAILFEEKTKLNVAYLVLAKGFVLITLLLADVGTSLIVNVVGFMYPAYKTLSSMGQMDSESKRKGKSSSEAVSVSCSSTSYWLMYWIIYNSFGLVESIVGSDMLVYWVPLYYTFKLWLLLWSMLPQFRGCDWVYKQLFVGATTTASNADTSTKTATTGGPVATSSSSAAAVVAAAAAKRSEQREGQAVSQVNQEHDDVGNRQASSDSAVKSSSNKSILVNEDACEYVDIAGADASSHNNTNTNTTNKNSNNEADVDCVTRSNNSGNITTAVEEVGV